VYQGLHPQQLVRACFRGGALRRLLAQAVGGAGILVLLIGLLELGGALLAVDEGVQFLRYVAAEDQGRQG
jgi:hypothetical protein